MKFTLSWLKEHLATEATLDEIVEGLIGVGLEVEEVIDPASKLAPFKVAFVRKVEKHPNADRLKICIVETTEGIFQVVCGAPNARTGMKGIFAHVGSHIPGTNVNLQKSMIRGVESNGMLLSERELMISQNHEGIFEAEESLTIGTPAAVALGLNDPMIYVKVTPNRPDALGVRGIARDLAAKGLGSLKPLESAPVPGKFTSPIDVELRFGSGDAKACPLFVGRYIRGVKNSPSPLWLRRRLEAIGLRSISVLVDITNFITIGFGRPLHVFDADKINGPIHARMAREGETIQALDGKTYALDPTMTVIADTDGVEGIAGIMGGESSGCTEDTANVLIEAALFDPLRTAATGRKLGIQSDARYRFERGVDPQFVLVGAEIATRMILNLCGGQPSNLIVAGHVPDTTRSYTLRKTRVKTLGGVNVPWPEQKRILSTLGFGVSEAAGGLACSVPSWRPDIGGEADLVEEVCRIVGLDKIPEDPIPRIHAVAPPVLNTLQRRMIAARRELASRGLNEAVTWSFVSGAQAALFGGGSPSLRLANPISSELTDMRPSLLPNLLAAAERNLSRGSENITLFEIGQVYFGDLPADESIAAAGLRQGMTNKRHWCEKQRSVDVFDAKGDAIAVLEAAGAPVASLQVVAGGPSWFHPGRSGVLQLGANNTLASFGELHPGILRGHEAKSPVVAFEVLLDKIPLPRSHATSRPPLAISDLMPVSRDFAFVVDESVEAEEIVRAARSADRMLITAVDVFDIFSGGAIGQGKKSVGIEVVLQPRERTLTDSDIDAIAAKIVAQVAKATGASLRT